MDTTVTDDMSKFGYRELDMAGDLLKAFKTDKDKTEYLDDGVKVWFNANSGSVFLCDDEYNTAMMNGEDLEDWFSCPICGHEGFREDMGHHGDDECGEYLEGIGVKHSPTDEL